jgi:hypothetical protein
LARVLLVQGNWFDGAIGVTMRASGTPSKVSSLPRHSIVASRREDQRGHGWKPAACGTLMRKAWTPGVKDVLSITIPISACKTEDPRVCSISMGGTFNV